ncbi:MAG: LapA family protein [Desulfobacterales bacterium]
MIRNVVFICLMAVVLIFVIQNTQVVEFRFLVWTISISRALMLFGTLATGFIAGWLLTLPKGKKKPQDKRR